MTQLYKPKDFMGEQVIVVVNFLFKKTINIMSKCLVIGGG